MRAKHILMLSLSKHEACTEIATDRNLLSTLLERR